MQYVGASVGGVIDAPMQAIWELISNPVRHPELAGSGEVQSVEVVSGPMGLGAIFQSRQNMRGIEYATANRVVIWQPPYNIAWRIGFPFAPGVAQIWMFSLTPAFGGTLVENGVVLPFVVPSIFPFSMIRKEIARRQIAVMYPTLSNISQLLGVAAPTQLTAAYDPPSMVSVLLPSPLIQGAAMAGGLATLLLAMKKKSRARAA
ncbi:MAG: DNA methyltransferase [Chloroflexia bacterium]|nr:DNA methyltransferase [Chloroflexia bacterium]